jgi:hypothetical protein
MAKKRKKNVADRLAKKRGRRRAESRLKRKKPPKRGKAAPVMSDDERRATENAIMKSPFLLSLPQLERIHLDPERMTEYLKEVERRGLEDSQEFVRAGLGELADEELLGKVRVGLTHYVQTHGEGNPESAFSASLVLTLMEKMDDLSQIPFFAFLFVREAKGHPMADDPVIWKLLSPFLPPKIVKPEEEAKPQEKEEAFERSKDFPHIVVPKGYAGELKKEGSDA